MELIFWLAILAVCWFLYTNQENYVSVNDCNCIDCGICRNRKGNNVCVPGNEYGPYFSEDCMNYTHSSLYRPYYNDAYYYNRHPSRSNIHSHYSRPNSHRPNSPRPHSPRPHSPRPHSPRPNSPRPNSPRPNSPRPNSPRPNSPRPK